MGCCGKKIKNIIKGNVQLVSEKLPVYGTKYTGTDRRIRVCQKCDENTWMSGLEYAAWLASNGIKVLKNLDDLTVLPKLPKKTDGKNLYCRLCKCFIPAKARVEAEKCPLNKWGDT